MIVWINGVVLLNVSFVIGFMVMLLIWVTTSLILLLSQIGQLYRQIMNEEDAKLFVQRNDEIGEGGCTCDMEFTAKETKSLRKQLFCPGE